MLVVGQNRLLATRSPPLLEAVDAIVGSSGAVRSVCACGLAVGCLVAVSPEIGDCRQRNQLAFAAGIRNQNNVKANVFLRLSPTVQQLRWL